MTDAMNQFMGRIAAASPEAAAMVAEHMKTYREFLGHVFMGELVAWMSNELAKADAGTPVAVERLILVLDSSYMTLGADVDNAIEASFLEAFYYQDLAESLLGLQLKAALDRMRSAT